MFQIFLNWSIAAAIGFINEFNCGLCLVNSLLITILNPTLNQLVDHPPFMVAIIFDHDPFPKTFLGTLRSPIKSINFPYITRWWWSKHRNEPLVVGNHGSAEPCPKSFDNSVSYCRIPNLPKTHCRPGQWSQQGVTASFGQLFNPQVCSLSHYVAKPGSSPRATSGCQRFSGTLEVIRCTFTICSAQTLQCRRGASPFWASGFSVIFGQSNSYMILGLTIQTNSWMWLTAQVRTDWSS